MECQDKHTSDPWGSQEYNAPVTKKEKAAEAVVVDIGGEKVDSARIPDRLDPDTFVITCCNCILTHDTRDR